MPIMIDPRAAERAIHDLTKLLEQEGFESIEEANDFLAHIVRDGVSPAFEPETPLEQAQDVMYEAWGETNPRKRLRLAKKALKISPDCADAYVLLAEDTAKSAAQARDIYQQGVEAGERALGPDFFKEYKGDFWGMIDSRPYMRALFGLAECEWELGERQHAVELYRRALELNPGDNQGVRYRLLAALIALNDTNGARILLRRYKDDYAASWAYGRALVTFLEKGNTRHSRGLLQEALNRNIHFAAYLVGAIPLPDELPQFVEPGTQSEGVSCFIEQGAIWMEHPEAIPWIVQTIAAMGPPPLADDARW
jgi:tetratricopeptide (TPR) repeat protein